MSTSEKQVDNEQLDPTAPHAIYTPDSVMLDVYHHDQPERHSFGLAFHNPVDPQPGGAVALPGVSDTPAREDHVHPIQTVAPACWWGACNGATIPAGSFVTLVLSTPSYANGFHYSAGKAVCDVAGKYLIFATYAGTQNNTTSPYLDTHINIDRPIGTLLAYQSVVLSSWIALSGGWQSGSGPLMFDLQVGDAVYLSVSVAAGSWTADTRTTLAIIPVGGMPGPPGPVGPSITAQQSSYWFGTQTVNQATGNDVDTAITWAQIFTNNISLVSGNRITVSQAGKYKVTSELGWQQSGTAGGYSRIKLRHYNAAGTLVLEASVVGPGAAAGAYSQVVGDGIFDMAAGDYIMVYGAVAASGTFIATSYVTVVPVGGVKGDTGPQGPDVTLVQSSYFFGLNTMGSGIATLAFGQLTWSSIFNNNISLGAGTGLANGAIVFSQAGKYLVNVSLGFSVSGGSSVSTVARFNHYNSLGVLKVQRDTFGNPVPAGQFAAANGSVILDVAAGDYVQIYAQPNGATITVDTTRAWVEIVPVGGTKGDPGIQGPSGGPVPAGGVTGQTIVKQSAIDFAVAWGTTAGAWNVLPLGSNWSHYGAGWQSGRYRLEDAGATVRVEGLLVHGAVIGSDTTFAILPAGFRPSGSLIFLCDLYQSAEGTAYYAINPDGTFVARAGWNTSLAASYLSIGSITFGLG